MPPHTISLDQRGAAEPAHAIARARPSGAAPCAVPRRSYVSGDIAVHECARWASVGALCDRCANLSGGNSMENRVRLGLLVLALIAGACGHKSSAVPGGREPQQARTDRTADTVAAGGYRIDHLEAHLIFDAGGVSSFDVLETPTNHPALWNTIIGEGIATDSNGMHHASNSTLVVVVVAGPPNARASGVVASLQVQGRELRSDAYTRLVPPLDSRGLASLEFRLHDTGCDSLRIRVRLNVGAQGSSDGLIAFECGE
jgi:hypothetical protein